MFVCVFQEYDCFTRSLILKENEKPLLQYCSPHIFREIGNLQRQVAATKNVKKSNGRIEVRNAKSFSHCSTCFSLSSVLIWISHFASYSWVLFSLYEMESLSIASTLFITLGQSCAAIGKEILCHSHPNSLHWTVNSIIDLGIRFNFQVFWILNMFSPILYTRPLVKLVLIIAIVFVSLIVSSLFWGC